MTVAAGSLWLEFMSIRAVRIRMLPVTAHDLLATALGADSEMGMAARSSLLATIDFDTPKPQTVDLHVDALVAVMVSAASAFRQDGELRRLDVLARRSRATLAAYAQHPWFHGHASAGRQTHSITAWLRHGLLVPWATGPECQPVILDPDIKACPDGVRRTFFTIRKA